MIVVGVMGSGKELEREENVWLGRSALQLPNWDIIFSQAAVVGRWRL
jgi:hypothetical protein